MTPDLKWSEIVVVDNGEEILEAPPLYCAAKEGPLNQTNYQRFSRVFHIPGSELSNLDPAVHIDVQSGLKFKLFTFGAGIDFYVSIFFQSYDDGENVYNSVSAQGCFKYNGVYNYSIIVGIWYVCTSMGGVGLGGGGVQYNPIAMVQMHGIKFYLSTHYDTYEPVIEGVSQAGGLFVDGLIPGYNTANPSAYQSWDHIQEDNTYFLELMNTDRSTWVSNPKYFYYGYDTTTISITGTVFACGDLDSLYTVLKTTFTDDLANPFKSKEDNEPTQEFDPSTPGGGGGGYDGTSDPVDFPILPTGGALGSGAIKAYCPTTQELHDLFLKLWDTNIFDVDTFQKLVDNPLDAIISLHAIPVTPSIGTHAAHIFIGNFNTGVGMDSINNQYLTVDCGSVNTEEFWGSALDYNPYTKSSIYLPFVGIKDLNTDDVMKKNIRIKYNIDVINGDCVAFVKCGTAVLYKFAGNIKQNIPITGQRSDVPLKGLQATLAEAGGIMMGCAIGGPVGGAVAAGAGLSAASTVVGSKITTQRSGALSGNYGVLDDFVPYLIFHRPIQSLADKFKTFKGYPSNITARLSSLSGYTEVEYINLQNIPNATSAEMDEIKNLLKQGVLI